MSDVRVLTGLTAVVLLLAIVEMLRRRQLREKYAVLWLLTAILIMPLAFFPGAFDVLAGWLGVVDPPNLALFMGMSFLVLVCVHLSWEISRLEEETRILSEEIAMLRMDASPVRDE